MAALQSAGRNGTVTVSDGWVTIMPTRWARAAGHARGEIQLPTRQITGVQFSPARLGRLGFIRFITAGSPAQVTLKQAQRDAYSVWFARPANDAFGRVRDEVMRQIAAG